MTLHCQAIYLKQQPWSSGQVMAVTGH